MSIFNGIVTFFKVILYAIVASVIIFALVGIGAFIEDIYKERKFKKLVKSDPVKFIPDSLLSTNFKCQECGGIVPAKTNNKITLVCPFCKCTLTEAKQLIEKGYAEKKDQISYMSK